MRATTTSRYIALVYKDHLNDKKTYRRLSRANALNELDRIKKQVLAWLKKYKDIIPDSEKTYIKRSTSITNDKGEYLFAHFYVTGKVHKAGPLKTRPIVSVSGSILEGIGKWVDRYMQPYARNTTNYVSSSQDLLKKLSKLPKLPLTVQLFTFDARSMYTNIETDYTLELLRGEIPDHVLEALRIIMKNNVFQFSDRFYHQIDGTAMGTPPACTWATMAFSKHENKLRQDLFGGFF